MLSKVDMSWIDPVLPNRNSDEQVPRIQVLKDSPSPNGRHWFQVGLEHTELFHHVPPEVDAPQVHPLPVPPPLPPLLVLTAHAFNMLNGRTQALRTLLLSEFEDMLGRTGMEGDTLGDFHYVEELPEDVVPQVLVCSARCQ